MGAHGVRRAGACGDGAGEVVLRERRDRTRPRRRAPGQRGLRDGHPGDRQRAGPRDAALAQVDDPRAVLVGGLGLGFTAHEVLSDPRVERLVVVEIEEALVGWMRDGTVPHGPAYLADERLTVVAADIRRRSRRRRRRPTTWRCSTSTTAPASWCTTKRGDLRRVSCARSPASCDPAARSRSGRPRRRPLRDALTEVFGSATPIPFDVRLQDRDEQYWLYLARR